MRDGNAHAGRVRAVIGTRFLLRAQCPHSPRSHGGGQIPGAFSPGVVLSAAGNLSSSTKKGGLLEWIACRYMPGRMPGARDLARGD